MDSDGWRPLCPLDAAVVKVCRKEHYGCSDDKLEHREQADNYNRIHPLTWVVSEN